MRVLAVHGLTLKGGPRIAAAAGEHADDYLLSRPWWSPLASFPRPRAIEVADVRNRLLGAKRAGAEDYLLVTVVAFALTVVVTRWYLEFSGYPKVSAGGLHVAHVLWGGLLLIVGALLPMLFVGRRVMQLSAIATGVGVGLFIDEVGKFITESNDYFFAPAAPLIYGGALLLMLLWVTVRRRSGGTPQDALQMAVRSPSSRIRPDPSRIRTTRSGGCCWAGPRSWSVS